MSTVVDEGLALIRAGQSVLLSADLSTLGDTETVALVSELEVSRRVADAVDVRAVAELASRGAVAGFGATSVPDLVAGLTRVTRREARARVQRAVDLGPRRAVTGEPLAPIHPLTAAALSAGDISGAHVSVITECLGRIPADIAAACLDAAEAFLVQAARHEDPAALRRSGAVLLAHLNADGVEPREDEAERRRSFWLRANGDGSYTPGGRWTCELAARMLPILDTLAAPLPGVDGQRDPRSAGQRLHDAMDEIAGRLLRSGTLPESGGAPTSVIVRVDAEDLALTAQGQTGGIAQTAHGELISVKRLLHLADQGDITTVVLTASGQILDFGRTKRYATYAQRKALTARDGGCCFPACTRPSAWTEAHHIRAWIRDGDTDLDNLCLLCAFHHREHQRQGWTVHIADGRPRWTPPAWLDPSRRPRTNTAHHLPDLDFAH